jgi:RNA recognition motif-containing protein
MFFDDNDHPRGCAILDFATKDLAKEAVEKMHRHDLRGRKLVVREDFDVERDKSGKIIKGSGRLVVPRHSTE